MPHPPHARLRCAPASAALLVVMMVAMLVAMLAGCGSSGSPGAAKAPAPELRGLTLDGTAWDLADQRGRWVVVAFEASTCVPCQKEIPELARFAAEHPEVRVVSVGLAESAEDFGAFLAPFHVSWPALADRQGYLSDRWDVLSLPVTVVVDPEGRVQKRFATVTGRSELVAAITPT